MAGTFRLTGNSYNVTPEELFDLFGKFGPIRCVDILIHRFGCKKNSC